MYGNHPGPYAELPDRGERTLPPTARLGDSDYVVSSRAVLVGVDDDTGAPDLRARFEVRDGVPECVEFTLRARPDGRGVRTSDLKLFDLDGLTLNTFTRRGAIRRKPAGSKGPSEPISNEREWWEASGAVTNAQGGRRGVSERELQNVADIYRDHLDKHPTKAVMEGMAYGSMRTAARRVKQAEEAGLLPKTTSGRKRGR